MRCPSDSDLASGRDRPNQNSQVLHLLMFPAREKKWPRVACEFIFSAFFNQENVPRVLSCMEEEYPWILPQ